MEIEIYHNARCSKSRRALAALCKVGIELETIEYLDTPPTRDELRPLIEVAGLNVIDAACTKEAEHKELGLSKEPSDEEPLDAMVSHSRLIERPFVVTDKSARMVRPTEAVEEILQSVLTDSFGSPMLITKPKLNFPNNCCPTH